MVVSGPVDAGGAKLRQWEGGAVARWDMEAFLLWTSRVWRLYRNCLHNISDAGLGWAAMRCDAMRVVSVDAVRGTCVRRGRVCELRSNNARGQSILRRRAQQHNKHPPSLHKTTMIGDNPHNPA